MSNFQEFCYLVIQRDKANLKRRRLLYRLNKKLDEFGLRYRYHVKTEYAKKERATYRAQAEAMKKVAKNIYSPMRKELNIKCRYDGNNSVTSLKYQGENYYYSDIERYANAYLFETVLLSDNKVNDTYKDLV